MASQGPNSAGTAANGSTGALTWAASGGTLSAAIAAEGGENAYASTSSTDPTQTKDLRATNFGFAIPDGANITGWQVEWRVKDAAIGAHPVWYSAKTLVGGTASGDDRSTGASLTGSYAYYSFGGASDLWGLTPTPADVNGSGWGAHAQFTLQSEGEEPGFEFVYVDHVRMTVYYSLGGTLLAAQRIMAVV